MIRAIAHKVYIAIKYHQDNRNKEQIEKISNALEQNGFETVCIVRDVEQWGQVKYDPEQLMQRSFAEIDGCDIVVIDLTEKGVGLGIEAGYAYAKDIPIITIAKQGSDISETLRGISCKLFFYQEFDELAHIFKQIVVQRNKW